MGLGEQYCRQLRRNFTGLHANFPPNRPLALGDYGVKRNDVFQRLGNITQLGVAFSAVDGAAQSSFQFKSDGAVDVEFVAKGDVRPGGVPAARAGLEIRFTRQDAVFFNASGCVVRQIDDLLGVGEELVGLLRDGRWDSEFLVVTSLVRAAQTTAIASAGRTSEVALEAGSDALQQIDLADTSLRLRVKRSRSTALEVVTASDQAPLMQLSRLRGLFRDELRPEAALGGDAREMPFELVSDAIDLGTIETGDTYEDPSDETWPDEGEAALGAEFRPEARPSDFDVERAKTAYIPLLEACYALANQHPVAFPSGYTPLAEIRAELDEVTDADDQPMIQEAIELDIEAVEVAVVDATAFGFVVEETTTGAVLICIRGTRTPREWLANFTAVPNPFTVVPGFGAVHLGFERLYRSLRQSIVSALMTVPTDTRLTVVGHSLGGAIGVLAAADIARNLGRRNLDVCTFGAPRTGKVMFRRNFDRDVPRCVRITNQFDVVPHVPSIVTGWNHVGEEIEVDGDVDNPHSLHAYFQGLYGIGEVRELMPASAAAESLATGRVVSVRLP